MRVTVRSHSRRGVSLVEVIVALTLFALGGSLATRLLMAVALHLEGAELGLRAALLLAEMRDGPVGDERAAGPGVLVPEGAEEAGVLRVRFEPRHPDATPSTPGLGGFRAPRSWEIGGDP